MSDIAGQAANAAGDISSQVADSTVGSEGSTQESVTPDSSGGDQGGINPAWNDLLNLIPSSLHDGVLPHLKNWDKNFQTKLHEVQSQYAPYEAFKDTPAEQLEQAMNFYRVMEENPEAVYQQMQEFYGFGSGDQGQQGQDDTGEEEFDIDGGTDDEILNHPKVRELLQNQEVVAQYLVQQQQQQEMGEFEQQMDAEVASIKEANPEFSEADEILMYQIAAASDISLTEAATQVKSYAESIAQRSAAPKAPSVMGASGFVPAAQNVDPRKLNGTDTRKLVADLITQSRENGQ